MLFLVALLLALMVSGCQGFHLSAAVETGSVPTAVSTEMNTPPVGTDGYEEQKIGWAAVIRALDLWKKNDGEGAVLEITQAENLGGDDTAFFLHAGDVLAQSSAWSLAAVMYLNLKRIETDNLPLEQLNKLHEAAYRSGDDPQASQVFMVYHDPILDMGSIRATLRGGDIATAEKEIALVTGDVRLLAQFPEALMVETEVLIAQKQWHKANEDLDKLKAMPNLPAWIINEESHLRGLAQPY